MKMPITRSNALKELYPKDKLMEAFGKINPTISDRANHRNNLWNEWRKNSVRIDCTTWTDLCYKLIKALQEEKYKEIFDYQCRSVPNGGAEIRFKNEDAVANFRLVLAQAKLSW
jgi:hypothetical protein